jgi:hypothetical protein
MTRRGLAKADASTSAQPNEKSSAAAARNPHELRRVSPTRTPLQTRAAVSWSGSEEALLPPRPLRTGHAGFLAPGSSIGQRTRRLGARGCPIGLGTNLGVTTAEPATEMFSVAAGAPATAVAAVPTSLHPSRRRLADASRPPTPEGSRPAFAGGNVPTPIRPITGRHSLAPSSCTRSPIGSPCGSLSLAGGLRAYHVPPTQPSGLGRVSEPVVRHLRPGSVEPRHLATHLLVQA